MSSGAELGFLLDPTVEQLFRALASRVDVHFFIEAVFVIVICYLLFQKVKPRFLVSLVKTRRTMNSEIPKSLVRRGFTRRTRENRQTPIPYERGTLYSPFPKPGVHAQQVARQAVGEGDRRALPRLAAGAAGEATQGQIDGFFSQLPYKCHQNRVASVGD